MLKNRIIIKATLVLALILGGETTSATGSKPPLRIGLALSGGGARGLAHIGVLKVLESENIPIHFISGTSIGAVVGGLYAAGWSPDQIEEHFTSVDWQDIFKDQPRRNEISLDQKEKFDRYILTLPIRRKKVGLPSGLIAGQKLRQLLSRLVWPAIQTHDFTQLRIPFCALATDLETGESVRLTEGDLAEAIHASMAIPSVFSPQWVKGRLLADGMLVRNFPVEDVKDLGANYVIGVDVGAGLSETQELKSILDIMDQAVSFRSGQDIEKQHKLCDQLIIPAVQNHSRSDFSRVQALVKIGEAAAQKIIDDLKSKLQGVSVSPPISQGPKVEITALQLEKIELRGLKHISENLVKKELNLKLPAAIEASKIERAVQRLYSSLLFESVSYSIENNTLILKLVEQTTGSFGFGLRYDSENRTSFILNSTVRNLHRHYSRSAWDLILGNKNRIENESFFFFHTGIENLSGLRCKTFYREFDSRVEAAGLSTVIPYKGLGVEFLAGSILDNNHGTGFGLKMEKNWIDRQGSIASLLKQEKLFEVFATVMVDSLDRTHFAKVGTFFLLNLDFAPHAINSDADYIRNLGIYQKSLPLTKTWSLLVGWKQGHIRGPKIPRYRRFSLGGVQPFTKEASFPGVPPFFVGGNHLQAFQIGVHRELPSKRFMRLQFQAGITTDNSSELYQYGKMIKTTGLTLGAFTAMGPLETTIAFNDENHFSTFLRLGHQF